MKNVSEILDYFFKPLPPSPPSPPDTLDLVVCYASVITLACTSIYCGSIGSLPYRQRHKDKDEKDRHGDSDGEDDVLEEKITTDDAWLFPIFGSCMLFGLYLLLRYLGPEWVNEILRYWFAVMSWGAVFRVHPLLIYYTILYDHCTDHSSRRVIPSQDSPWANNDGRPVHGIPSVLLAGFTTRRNLHPLPLPYSP